MPLAGAIEIRLYSVELARTKMLGWSIFYGVFMGM